MGRSTPFVDPNIPRPRFQIDLLALVRHYVIALDRLRPHFIIPWGKILETKTQDLRLIA